MLKGLIKKQTIIIDDHSRCTAHAYFDDDNADIHLDKKAKTGEYRIRVPLNTNRPVRVEIRGRRNAQEIVPNNIREEVREAFADPDTRADFIRDLIDTLKNYPYLEPRREARRRRDIDKAYGALRRLSKHFGLEWSNRTVRLYLKEYMTYGTRCMATITDGPDMYYLAIDKKQIVASDYMMIHHQDQSSWEEYHGIDDF